MKIVKRIAVFALIVFSAFQIQAQNELDSKEIKDSLFIHEVEELKEPDKILHAEPLYIDLIRDLGARKGEKEWNIGFGLTDNDKYDEYTALVEYEWAPINRLGLEIELPFSFYYPTNGNNEAPGSNLNSIKLAAQYSFLVSEKYKTTLAIGYLHEFEMIDFKRYGQEKLLKGNLYNPFFIAAMRWGNNFHTLLYTGPAFEQNFKHKSLHTTWEIHSNFHYMIAGTRNFIGVEVNKYVDNEGLKMVMRPQMRVGITDNLLIGIVIGVPAKRASERLSTFLRLIYEPGH